MDKLGRLHKKNGSRSMPPQGLQI